jgi:flagellar motor switch/type III secretory pathway protein FliN
LRAVRRWAAGHVHLGAVESALGALLGTGVGIRMRRVETLAGARAFGAGYGVQVASDGASTVQALLQAESALATAVVARAIQRAPPLFQKAERESAAIAGAFAAVVAAVARRAHSTALLRVVSAGAADDLRASLPDAADDLATIALTVTVADDAYTARVILPMRLARDAPAPAWTRTTLSALGATPLSLPVVAAAFEAMTLDIASLRPGDALMPPKWPLTRAANGNGWVGPVWLAAPSEAIGVTSEVSDEGRLVLGGDSQALWVREAEMVESDESTALVSAIGEVSVLVRVEIGEARMAAREWAALERGDVVALGRRIGERVVLRVGGVPVATGELVEIDGDVGVRIVERLNLGHTSP